MAVVAIAVELRLSVLIGTASRPDMQKIRIMVFFFENSYSGSWKWKRISTNGSFRLQIY